MTIPKGKLFLVPTPIGNLEDITLRGIRILKEVDLILAEDTRTSGILLKHLDIHKPVYAHHKFNEHKALPGIIEKLMTGSNLALISDAGTPGISDPGYLIVRKCLDQDIEVECLPGPTAFIPALVNSGLPAERFIFEGFLPVKKGRNKRLQELADEKRTMIFYESPFRVIKTLENLRQVLSGKREASVSREISKVYEETIRGTLDYLLEHLKKSKPKGEFVIVVKGN